MGEYITKHLGEERVLFFEMFLCLAGKAVWVRRLREVRAAFGEHVGSGSV